MRKHRTPTAPLFDMKRPLAAHWEWVVLYRVASSGYPTMCHVTASCGEPLGLTVGTAQCDVTLGDDLREVIECLAIESMLAACEPTLDGTPTHRRVVFSSNL